MPMRKKRPGNLSPEDQDAAEEFIDGAEDVPDDSISESDSSPDYPWEEPHVRDDVHQTYPLRLPEPLHLKLKYVSEETGSSMNEICNRAVREAVEDKLQDLE